jgi:hypothetical protein
MKLITFKDTRGTHVGTMIDNRDCIIDLKAAAESKVWDSEKLKG